MKREVIGILGLMMGSEDPVRPLDSRPGDPVYFDQLIRNSEKYRNYWRALSDVEQESVRKFLTKFRVPREVE